MYFDDRDRLSFRLSPEDRADLDLIMRHLLYFGFSPTGSDCIHFAIHSAAHTLRSKHRDRKGD